MYISFTLRALHIKKEKKYEKISIEIGNVFCFYDFLKLGDIIYGCGTYNIENVFLNSSLSAFTGINGGLEH